jgi:prepilin-type N-terminal cleavage/methylation domain-containing protein/prepilin-type processing-associated H-X9-DG protein
VSVQHETRGRVPNNAALRGFTLVEVLIVFGIIAVLASLLLAALEKGRHQAYIAKCATNLHSIGEAMLMYANENHGSFPRAKFVPGAPLVSGTGVTSTDPFSNNGPQPNDVTASIFLLIREQKTGTAIFICPYNDVTNFSADDVADVTSHSNFTDYRTNLGYSFANPYPDAAAEKKDYRWDARRRADFAIGADLNPAAPSAASLTPTSSNAQLSQANSRNHETDGQNVLYGDGHVAWEHSVFVGVNDDHIYVNRHNQLMASPIDRDDSVLVPTR